MQSKIKKDAYVSTQSELHGTAKISSPKIEKEKRIFDFKISFFERNSG
jgi:hypothetical protein